jgi:hypothetical protein
VTHNYLSHTELRTRTANQRACTAGDPKACQAVTALDTTSTNRNSVVRDGVLVVSEQQANQILGNMQTTMVGLQEYRGDLQNQLNNNADPNQRAEIQRQINEVDSNMRQIANLGKDYNYSLFESTNNPSYLAAYARLNVATNNNDMVDGLMSGVAVMGPNNRPRPATATPSYITDTPISVSQTSTPPLRLPVGDEPLGTGATGKPAIAAPDPAQTQANQVAST